ncbi:MAG: OmpH family outer membrane protein [Desulfomonilaceae bacterium]
MMKTRALITGFSAATVLFFFLGICQAQEIKIGFVDLMKLTERSQRAKEHQQKFGQLVEKKRTALENKKKELMDLQEQFSKQGPMLKPETRDLKMKEIGIKEMEFKMEEKNAQADLQNEQREAQEVIQRDLRKIIGQIRSQKKLTLVVNADALLSADDALDITEEVVKQYDSEAGRAPAAKPAPAPKPAGPTPGPAAAPGATKPKPR